MVKIYTKTGDSGETSLFGGQRVKKNDLRIEAIGTIDELNSALGLALTETKNSTTKKILSELQNKLFEIGAELANPKKVGEKKNLFKIVESDVFNLESLIDELDSKLKPLNQFILPGGTSAAAQLHLARNICRRAERRVLAVFGTNPVLIKYINRLSDLLFVLARIENKTAKVKDIPWSKP